MYEDDYPTCSQTFATIRIYSEDKLPEDISSFLEIDPTESFKKGQTKKRMRTEVYSKNGWFYSTKEQVESKDLRRHLDLILKVFLPVKEKLKDLTNNDAAIDISCFWLSEQGHGGPTLSPTQLQGLSNLGIELWFDLY